MTPVLPPFYRIFMGGIVPSRERGDPAWLVDGAQRLANALPFNASSWLTPGTQLGPLPYAPLLTSLVSPYAFGFLVGPAKVNRRSDGGLGGLVVEKCKFLQESNCKGICLNSYKLPTQELFVPHCILPRCSQALTNSVNSTGGKYKIEQVSSAWCMQAFMQAQC